MRNIPFWGAMLLAVVSTGCGGVPDPDESGPEDQVVFAEDAEPAVAALPYVENELLVQPYPGADAETLGTVYAELGAVPVETLGQIDMVVLDVAPDRFDATAAALGESGLIETVQKNYLYEPNDVPNDPMFTDQTYLAQIRAEDAWATTVGSDQILIAIVDTGVDPGHPDLAGKIIDGWNVYEQNTDFADHHGHGTSVAGVAAAVSDNGLGVAGVTWNSPLLPIRVTDAQGRSSARDIAAGILWALAHEAKVINVSFAPLWSNRVVRSAAREAFHRGSLVVVSAGNGGETADARGYAEALFVGGLNSSGRAATFTDRGPFIDICAPGVLIHSTELGGGYGFVSGTSFAAPMVTGVAALVWSVNPDLRPVSVVAAIIDSAVDLDAAGRDDTCGHGAVDAAAAVQDAQRRSYVPDTTPPQLSVDRPGNGATIWGRYVARVTVTDEWGVADVVLSIDGAPYATDTRAPYRFVIDTTRFAAGIHELRFAATDISGNASRPGVVTVTFRPSSRSSNASPTSITFHSPSDGASVSGDVVIQASVQDGDGLATVEWLADGEPLFAAPVTGSSTGVSYLWHANDFGAGSHTVSLVVRDAHGDTTTGQLGLVVGR